MNNDLYFQCISVDVGVPTLGDLRFTSNTIQVNQAYQNAQKLFNLQHFAHANNIDHAYR